MVSFAAIELHGGIPSGRVLSLIFNPGRKSHPQALKVHGLADTLLKHQNPFAHHAEEIRDFLLGSILVGHNVEFDISFVNNELTLAGHRHLVCESICTMTTYRNQFAGRAGLDAVATQFGIDVDARSKFHGAFVDAEITSRLFQKMVLGNATLHHTPHLSPMNLIEPPPIPAKRTTAATVVRNAQISHGVVGKAFAFTGEMDAMSRDEAAVVVVAMGGTLHRTVRKDTDFLVVGAAPGATKLNTAAERQARYGKPENIDEATFLKILQLPSEHAGS